MLYTKINRMITDGNVQRPAEVTTVKIKIIDGEPHLMQVFRKVNANFEIVHDGNGIIFEICPLEREIVCRLGVDK